MKTMQTNPSASRRMRGGFTLIEMLVVVIIIGILAGMVLGLMKVSSQWTARTKTDNALGAVRAAIEEFHAEYGEYPPVSAAAYGTQPFGYEYPWSNQVNAVGIDNAVSGNAQWNTAPVFTFGLMSFLVQRYGDEWNRGGPYHANNIEAGLPNAFNMSQWLNYNASGASDQQRDINAIMRWKSLIQNVQSLQYRTENNAVGGAHIYTNLYLTVLDGWGQELNYASPPPYQSFKLWSSGQPGGSVTNAISTGAGY